MESYRDCVLPVIVLECNHVFTVETLDNALALEKYYCRDERGAWTSKYPASSSEITKLPMCLVCRYLIRNVKRYGRIIKQAMLDQATKLFYSRGRRMLSATYVGEQPMTDKHFVKI